MDSDYYNIQKGKTMWQSAVLHAVVLFSTTLAEDQPCYSDAPDNCTFMSGLSSCNWTFDSTVWTYDRSSAVFGTGGSLRENMTSKTVCSTGGDEHCLHISYFFEVNNTGIRVLLIKVRDEDDRDYGREQLGSDSREQLGSDSSEQLGSDSSEQLGSDSSEQLGSDSSEQLGSDSSEQLGSDSSEQLGNDSSEQLGSDSGEQLGSDSSEQQGDDSRELVAWNATDSGTGMWHVASIPIQSMDNFTITVEARKFTQVEGRIFIGNIIFIKASCSALQTSTIPSPGTKTQEGTTTICSHVSTEASNDVGLVVGGVVAVIVIVVAVVFFILYRRKRLHMWKTCFRNKNEKDASGISHSGEKSVGKYNKSTTKGVNATPTISRHNNHAFTASESQHSDTYYSVIKDTDESGDSAAPHYSTIQEFQSADGRTLTSSSKLTDDDPYEIKAVNGHFTSISAASRHANAYANLKGKTGLHGKPLPPAFNGDNRQSPADYSLARETGDEATGVYHCLEEDPNNHGERGDTGLYHYAKDPDINPEAGADAKGVYHILEKDPAITRDNQSLGIYHEPKDEQMGQQTAKVSKGQTGNYNTLDFVGKRSDLKTHEDGSGGVYNHLGAESDDPYNEVDRDVRLEVIDGEYSHIKLSDC